MRTCWFDQLRQQLATERRSRGAAEPFRVKIALRRSESILSGAPVNENGPRVGPFLFTCVFRPRKRTLFDKMRKHFGRTTNRQESRFGRTSAARSPAGRDAGCISSTRPEGVSWRSQRIHRDRCSRSTDAAGEAAQLPFHPVGRALSRPRRSQLLTHSWVKRLCDDD